MIIDFHKRVTPMGPPVEHRISKDNVEKICNNSGFKTIDAFSQGDNFYSIVFKFK